jgi:hypothetical protein
MNIHSTNISLAKPVLAARRLKANTEEIKFATGKSELGTVLVARSASGVCAILIGDGTEVLKRDLAEKFTDAKLVQAQEKVTQVAAPSRSRLICIYTFLESLSRSLCICTYSRRPSM